MKVKMKINENPHVSKKFQYRRKKWKKSGRFVEKKINQQLEKQQMVCKNEMKKPTREDWGKQYHWNGK